MKILVFADKLQVGGTQVNAIDLSTSLRDRFGHEVAMFATPGPMSELVARNRLRLHAAPDARVHPSPAKMRALRDVVRRERPDLIHVWDWPQCLDSYYASHLLDGLPMVLTVMSMGVPRLLPKALPTTFGTPELVDKARAAGRHPVEMVLPPVDVHLNAPGAVDAGAFRRQFGISSGDITLVTVSRLIGWLKGESLRRTIDAVRVLGRELPLRLVIVGDGPARAGLEALARQANEELGRTAVALAGAMVDPRPAYEAADVVVGMGGSGLRGMAFAKPVIIVGESNFSAPFNRDTADSFYYKGIYGLGDGAPGNARLVADVRALATRPEQFPALGSFCREFVLRHFSVEAVGARLAQFVDAAAAMPRRRRTAAADGIRTAVMGVAGAAARSSIRQQIARIRRGIKWLADAGERRPSAPLRPAASGPRP